MSDNSKYQKELIKYVEDKAVSDILKEKIAGAAPAAARDSYRQKIESLHVVGSTISKDGLYKRVNRLWKATKGKLPVPVVAPLPPPITTSPPSEVIVDSGTSEVSSLPSISPNDNPPTDQHEIVPDALVPKAGRPVGTTNEKKREDAEKHKRCVNSIAYAYSTQVTVSKASKTRCPKGFLLDLIQKKKLEFGVQSVIYEATIRTRVKRGNLYLPDDPWGMIGNEKKAFY